MALSVISSYLYFNVVSTGDNDDRKSNKHTHRSLAACGTAMTSNLREYWNVVDTRRARIASQRLRAEESDELRELRVKVVSVMMRR